jgi:hypothetical protein
MKIKRTISIAVVCVLLVTVFSAVMVYAPPPEDVGPPTIQDVFVTNEGVAEAVPVELTNTPVPVEVVNSLEFEPVQFYCAFSIPSGISGGSDPEAFEVPAGKFLVMEYVSARVEDLQADAVLGLELITTVNGELRPTFIGAVESQDYLRWLSKEVKCYADPETFVQVFALCSPRLNTVNVIVSISGYLVDAS